MLKLILLLSITIIFGDPQTLKAKEVKEDLIDDPQVRGSTLNQKLNNTVKQSSSKNEIGIQSKDDVKMKEKITKNVKDQMSKKLMGYSPRYHGYDLNDRHPLYWLWWWSKYTQETQESENKNRQRGECYCGLVNRKTNGRIINGEDAEKNEYPWIVAIGAPRRPYKPAYFSSFCGGTIISTKTVLTAAHCMPTAIKWNQKGPVYVAIGEHKRFEMDAGQRFVEVCNIKDHPKYKRIKDDFNYDYAIITLCEELKWSYKVSPVCLPDISGRGAKYENRKAIVAGWGQIDGYDPASGSNVLQEAVLTTKTNKYCKAYDWSEITDSMICGLNMQQSGCQGDSGGPLVVQDDRTKAFTIIGIVSYGHEKCKLGVSTVFARVTHELYWIKKHIQGSRYRCF